MEEIVDYDLFQKMKALDRRQDLDGNSFSKETCCDYLDSLIRDGDKFGVIVFVEPCGNLVKMGNNWSEILDWWIEVFQIQPKKRDYVESGWYLDDLSEKGFPDDPRKVWKDRKIWKTLDKLYSGE
jgi:hypothetical protein